MEKDKNKIPKGHYCYKKLVDIGGSEYRIVGLCPYWSIRKGKPKHENGYCKFLGKGDWDINKETTLVNTKTKEEIKGILISLIWDQVKECGINMEKGVNE